MAIEHKYDFAHNDYTLDDGCLCSTERIRSWIEMECAATPRFIPRGSDVDDFIEFCLTEAMDNKDEFVDMIWDGLDQKQVYGGRLMDAISEVVDDVISDFVGDQVDEFFGLE